MVEPLFYGRVLDLPTPWVMRLSQGSDHLTVQGQVGPHKELRFVKGQSGLEQAKKYPGWKGPTQAELDDILAAFVQPSEIPPRVRAIFEQTIKNAKAGRVRGMEEESYRIQCEPWRWSCLRYPEIRRMRLSNPLDQLRASFERFVRKEKAIGWVIREGIWVFESSLVRDPRIEFGVSVCLLERLRNPP